MESQIKSRSLRRVNTRLPAGRLVTRYRNKKASKAQCANCGAYLSGTARATRNSPNIPKTHKRPQRPYGGMLCSRCSRQKIVSQFRNLFKLS